MKMHDFFYFSVSKYDIFKYRIRCIIIKKSGIIHAIVCPDFFYLLKFFLPKNQSFLKFFLPKINRLYFFVALIKKPIRQI